MTDFPEKKHQISDSLTSLLTCKKIVCWTRRKGKYVVLYLEQQYCAAKTFILHLFFGAEQTNQMFYKTTEHIRGGTAPWLNIELDL